MEEDKNNTPTLDDIKKLLADKTQVVTITVVTDCLGISNVNLESGDMTSLELIGLLDTAKNESIKKWIISNDK